MIELFTHQIRSDHIGQKIKIKGNISRINSATVKTFNIKFECSSCGMIIRIDQENKRIKKPLICYECRNEKNFKILSKKQDYERIVHFDGFIKAYFYKKPLAVKLESFKKGDLVEITGMVDVKFRGNLTRGEYIMIAENIIKI